MSNCYEVHPDTNPGPFSHCGQEDISKRYAHLIHYEFVQKTCNMSDFFYICRKCERKFKPFFLGYWRKMIIMLLSLANYENVSCPPPSEKMCFLHHFDICDKRGDHTTDIDPF